LPTPRSQPVEPAASEAVVRPFPGAPGDAALVTALKARRPDAANLLFDRYGSYVERLVVRVLGLDTEVPDLINEVFARACERVDQLEDPSALKGWLGSIALFTSKTFLRDRRSRRRFLGFFAPEELPEVPVSGAPAEASAALLRTYQVLSTFPPDERIAFALRFIDGMGMNEIVEVMGLSIGTVKRRLTKAQERFVRAAERDPLLRERIAHSQRWGKT
jgi:RNA polymerase sigma-70 factor, ECF subfamily